MGSHFVVVEHGDLHESFFWFPLRAAQELVDLESRLFAVRYRIDDESRPESHVAGGENTGRSGHQSVGLDLQCALARGFDAVLGLHEGKIGNLLYRQDHRVTGNHGFGSQRERWIEALGVIEDRNALDDFEASKLPIRPHELLWAQRRTQLDALK